MRVARASRWPLRRTEQHLGPARVRCGQQRRKAQVVANDASGRHARHLDRRGRLAAGAEARRLRGRREEVDLVVGEDLPAGVEDPHLHLLGFSQGVATAARWLTHGRTRPVRAIFWGDFLPPDLDLAAAERSWADVEVILVRGDQDRTLQNDGLRDAEAARLQEVGHTVRRIEYAGGHDIDPDTLSGLVAEG